MSLGIGTLGPVTISQCPVWYKQLRMGGVTIDGDTGGWSGTIDYWVKMKDLNAFLVFAAGSPKSYSLPGGGTVTRIIPLSHPLSSRMLCTKINSVGKGGQTPTNDDWCNQWSDAHVKLTFTTVPWTSDGSTPFMVVNGRTGAEEYTLAGTKLAFADGTPIQADASVRVPTQVYSATIYQCFSPGDDVYLPLVGQINTNPVTIGAFQCPAGTVRFDSGGFEATTTADFQTAYTRNVLFTYRPIPWNQFLKPSGLWDTPTKPDGSFVYQSGNFAPIFA